MRFLLLILISISSNFLWSNVKTFICDIPYKVTPDLRHRAMVVIRPSYDGAILLFYEESKEIIKEGIEEKYVKVFSIESERFLYDFKVTRDSYKFGKWIYIDRIKAEMTDSTPLKRKTIRTCESVTLEEHQRALKEWVEYASEQTKIWYAENKNQLDKRKL